MHAQFPAGLNQPRSRQDRTPDAGTAASRSKHSHRQMSMPKPVCPNMATATALGPPGAETAEQQHARLLELDAQPSAARIRLPEGAARKVSASVRRACIRDTYAASGPNREPGRILIPGDGAAGDQEAQNRHACPAMAAKRRLRAVPSQRPPGAMVSAHMPSCNGQVTSTSVHMAKPGSASAPRITHRNNRTLCLWLEQFQIESLPIRGHGTGCLWG